MIPKEKAKELISNFYDACHSQDSDTEKIHNSAKDCALICVDEIIKTTFSKVKSWDRCKIIPQEESTAEYWLKVKEEINNY